MARDASLTNTAARLTQDMIDQLDLVASAMSKRDGVPYTRSHVLRLALGRGLESLKAELPASLLKATKKTRA